MINFSNPLTFVPLLIASLSLAYASFKAGKDKAIWILIAFVVWIVIFIITIFGNKLVG